MLFRSTFHIQVAENPPRLIEKLHKSGISASICLNPETPVDAIRNVAPLCDMVLVMTVHPGFGAQKFIDDAAKKVIEIRKIVGSNIRIEVDGGIDATTAPIVIGYGADTLVVGNAIFGKKDRTAAINDIRNSVR